MQHEWSVPQWENEREEAPQGEPWVVNDEVGTESIHKPFSSDSFDDGEGQNPESCTAERCEDEMPQSEFKLERIRWSFKLERIRWSWLDPSSTEERDEKISDAEQWRNVKVVSENLWDTILSEVGFYSLYKCLH